MNLRQTFWAISLTIIISIGLLFQSKCSAQVISGFEQLGGLNTSLPSHLIPDNDFQKLEDVFTDSPGYAYMRGGLLKVWQTTGPIQQQYENVRLNGKRYLIIKSSANVGYIDENSDYRVLLSTLPSNSRMWMIQYKDDCFLGTDQKTDRWKFVPPSLEVSTYIPCGKYPIVGNDKAFMLNISTPRKDLSGKWEPRIGTSGDESIMRYSSIGDLKDWPGDFWLGVSRDDGETISGGFIYKGNLYITKKHSVNLALDIWNDYNDDFEKIIPVSKTIGCISQDTIQEIAGLMYWLSDDGVVEWDGSTYNFISEDIEDEIAEISGNTAIGAVNEIFTSALDFGAGSSIVNVDTSTADGFITLKTSDNKINQRQDTEVASGRIGPAGIYAYQTFYTSYTLQVSTIAMYMRKESSSTAKPVQFTLKDNELISLAAVSISTNDVSIGWQWVPVNLSTFNIVLQADATYYIYLESDADFVSLILYPYVVGYNTNNSDYPRGSGKVFNNFEWFTAIDITFRVYMQHYTDGQYGEWGSKITYIEDWVQWGNISSSFSWTTEDSPVGNISWFVSAATASVFVNTSNLVKMTTGFNIGLSSGSYYMVFASMSIVEAGVSPKIDSVMVSYIAHGSEQVLASYGDQYNLHYWISGIKDDGVYNNVVYVYQIPNNKWTSLNLNARSFVKFNNDFYIGSSVPSNDATNIDGYSYDYTDDNGASINTKLRTKDFIPSGRLLDTQWIELWVYTQPSSIYTNMTLKYYRNKNSTAYKSPNIPQTAPSGWGNMFIKKRVPSSLILKRFRTISFEFLNFEQLYGYDFIFRPYEKAFK